MAGAVSQYLGAAIAVTLFKHLSPGGVALLRVFGAAVIVIVMRRAWRRHWSYADLRLAGAFGVSLAAMNLCFYLAMQRLPIGNAVAIEFAGPVAVAAWGARTKRSTAALALAAIGVITLVGVEADGTSAGAGFALLAGAFWGGYILLGHRVARRPDPVDGLGVGMLFGAVAISGFGVVDVAQSVDTPVILTAGLATGLLSNVIPYRIDQTVMRLVDPHRFALLQALLPVTATLVGLAVLAQIPNAQELFGIAAVAAAIAWNRLQPPELGGG